MNALGLAAVLLPLLIACSGKVGPAEAPSAGASRVFVEAVLARFDDSELALVRTSTMDRVITSNSPDVLSTIGALAEQGVPLVVDPGANASAEAPDQADVGVALNRFEVTPAITSEHAVKLDMTLMVTAEGGLHSFTKADLFAGSRLLVWNTDLRTRAGENIVMLVQPTIIESERDLQEILERRSAPTPPANQ